MLAMSFIDINKTVSNHINLDGSGAIWPLPRDGGTE